MAAPRTAWLGIVCAALAVVAVGCAAGRGGNRKLGTIGLEKPVELSFRPTRGPVVGFPVEGGNCQSAAPKLALIPVDGPLFNMTLKDGMGENPVGLFREQLDAVAATPGVCAVVLRINSVGGSVTATEIMHGELTRFKARTRLPVVACLMDVGTGGAYYLATAADVITAYPSTITGGVGVVLNLYNMREAMATANVLAQPIKSGEYVDMGSELSQLPDEVQVMLQGMADDSHLRFIQVVRAARPKLAALEDGLLFDGRVMTGQDALEAGLVDRVAGLPEVLDLARELSARPDASVLLFVRKEEQLRSIYATSYGGLSLQNIVPLSIPGLDRSKLPLFLYMWQPNPVPE